MKFILKLIILVAIVGGVYYGVTHNSTANRITSSVTGIINLSSQGLTQVTPDIYNQTNTTELILSNNSIRSLPSQMGRMTKVVTFKIDHNLLEGSLIGEIRQLSQLHALDVSYNNMTGMPAELGQLSNLQTLDYSYNKITGLPNELSSLKNNLKTFNLTGNPLTQSQISNLRATLPNTTIIF